MGVVRRLLEGTEAVPDTYPLICDTDHAASEVLHRDLIWQPPEILFACPSCKGTGQYVGRIEVEDASIAEVRDKPYFRKKSSRETSPAASCS